MYVYIIFNESPQENNGVPSSIIVTKSQRGECGGVVRSTGFIYGQPWVPVQALPSSSCDPIYSQSISSHTAEATF